MHKQYYAQYGQDEYLDKKIFKRKESGFFLDIGANDGITYSNTFFFEKNRHWNGICIEPHPTAFAKLITTRKCKTLNVGISKIEGQLEFLKIEGYSEMLSGLKDSYEKDHLERIENEIREHGGKQEVIMIPCRRLEKIIEENQIDKVDYCSIDIEGGEVDVLASMSEMLSEGAVDVLSIENNYHKDKLRKILKDFDYKLIATLKCDEIYRKRKKLFFF